MAVITNANTSTINIKNSPLLPRSSATPVAGWSQTFNSRSNWSFYVTLACALLLVLVQKRPAAKLTGLMMQMINGFSYLLFLFLSLFQAIRATATARSSSAWSWTASRTKASYSRSRRPLAAGRRSRRKRTFCAHLVSLLKVQLGLRVRKVKQNGRRFDRTAPQVSKLYLWGFENIELIRRFITKKSTYLERLSRSRPGHSHGMFKKRCGHEVCVTQFMTSHFKAMALSKCNDLKSSVFCDVIQISGLLLQTKMWQIVRRVLN